jgi:hypothetical protein
VWLRLYVHIYSDHHNSIFCCGWATFISVVQLLYTKKNKIVFYVTIFEFYSIHSIIYSESELGHVLFEPVCSKLQSESSLAVHKEENSWVCDRPRWPSDIRNTDIILAKFPISRQEAECTLLLGTHVELVDREVFQKQKDLLVNNVICDLQTKTLAWNFMPSSDQWAVSLWCGWGEGVGVKMGPENNVVAVFWTCLSDTYLFIYYQINWLISFRKKKSGENTCCCVLNIYQILQWQFIYSTIWELVLILAPCDASLLSLAMAAVWYSVQASHFRCWPRHHLLSGPGCLLATNDYALYPKHSIAYIVLCLSFNAPCSNHLFLS